MSLVENYITTSGYDYFGNAAEDTLVFFVRDEAAPYATIEDDENHFSRESESFQNKKEKQSEAIAPVKNEA